MRNSSSVRKSSVGNDKFKLDSLHKEMLSNDFDKPWTNSKTFSKKTLLVILAIFATLLTILGDFWIPVAVTLTVFAIIFIHNAFDVLERRFNWAQNAIEKLARIEIRHSYMPTYMSVYQVIKGALVNIDETFFDDHAHFVEQIENSLQNHNERTELLNEIKRKLKNVCELFMCVMTDSEAELFLAEEKPSLAAEVCTTIAECAEIDKLGGQLASIKIDILAEGPKNLFTLHRLVSDFLQALETEWQKH